MAQRNHDNEEIAYYDELFDGPAGETDANGYYPGQAEAELEEALNGPQPF